MKNTTYGVILNYFSLLIMKQATNTKKLNLVPGPLSRYLPISTTYFQSFQIPIFFLYYTLSWISFKRSESEVDSMAIKSKISSELKVKNYCTICCVLLCNLLYSYLNIYRTLVHSLSTLKFPIFFSLFLGLKRKIHILTIKYYDHK